MNIIVLGAGGFIGTNLTIALSKIENNRITVVDRDENRLNRLKISDKVNVIKNDLVLKLNFDDILRGQDIVYHLISTTVPSTSNRQIPKEINDNVKLMAELLEACVRCDVKKVIFLSSGGTVYGSRNRCPLKEEMETYPINSYGMQKVMNEKLLYLYQYLYGLDYRIIRLANPFGPYQEPDGIQGVISTFTYKALKNENINVYGDGSVVRDFIYIDDAVQAIMNIADGKGEERLFNVGSGCGTSIKQLLEIIEKVLKVSISVNYFPGRKVDVPVNYLDISRYERNFGKLVSVSLEEGIQKTLAFMRKAYL